MKHATIKPAMKLIALTVSAMSLLTAASALPSQSRDDLRYQPNAMAISPQEGRLHPRSGIFDVMHACKKATTDEKQQALAQCVDPIGRTDCLLTAAMGFESDDCKAALIEALGFKK